MKITIDIPEYDGNGIDVFWDIGAKCEITANYEAVTIKGNKAALLSIAKQLLYLCCNNELPYGSHVHLDDFFCKDGWKGISLILDVLSDK